MCKLTHLQQGYRVYFTIQIQYLMTIDRYIETMLSHGKLSMSQRCILFMFFLYILYHFL